MNESIHHQTMTKNIQQHAITTPKISQQTASISSKRTYLLKRSAFTQQPTLDKSDFFKISTLPTLGMDPFSTPMRNQSTIHSQSQPNSRLSKIVSSKNSVNYHPYFKAIDRKSKKHGSQQGSLAQLQKLQAMKLAVSALNKMKKKSQIHINEAFYNIQKNSFQQRNIRKMKRYIKNWQNKQLQRDNCSLLNRSRDKSQQYLIKHNIQLEKAQKLIPFEQQLRGRQQLFLNKLRNQAKWLTLDQQQTSQLSLKGKGGPSKPCYQQVYLVQQVYKAHKGKKMKNNQQANYELRRRLNKTLQRA